MKKLIPLILIIFVIGCGQDLRSDEMRREAQRPWAEFFGGFTGGSMGGGSLGSMGTGSFSMPGCNMSSCSMSSCGR